MCVCACMHVCVCAHACVHRVYCIYVYVINLMALRAHDQFRDNNYLMFPVHMVLGATYPPSRKLERFHHHCFQDYVYSLSGERSSQLAE